ncbi:MAG TPA: hypothetical protein VNY83_00055 [Solirubrobacterales bacterium]|jgi:hypothetical protein|nr:hypothetical protein [Solirubrobacterales bacterium]
MRQRAAIAAAALAVLAAAGCGSTDETTPVACLAGAGAYLRALHDAPGEAKLGGKVPIGECLPQNQKAGELATVGTAMVAAATRLNAEARADPGGHANLQLGYLLGAAQRGADATNGIHLELIRRLSAAARYSLDNRPLSPTFMHTYQRGFDAGHSGG